MDEPKSVKCPVDGEGEIASLYLKGELPEGEAMTFEEHYFQCERCAEAVAVGRRLRTAFGKAPVASVPTAAPAPWTWLPFAAAAAIALFAVGLWQMARKAPEHAPVMRGAAIGAFDVRVEPAPQGDLSVRWAPQPGAARYVVRVLTADARSIWSKETAEPHVSIEAGALAPAPLTIQIEALDAMERVVATGEAKVPGRGR